MTRPKPGDTVRISREFVVLSTGDTFGYDGYYVQDQPGQLFNDQNWDIEIIKSAPTVVYQTRYRGSRNGHWSPWMTVTVNQLAPEVKELLTANGDKETKISWRHSDNSQTQYRTKKS